VLLKDARPILSVDRAASFRGIAPEADLRERKLAEVETHDPEPKPQTHRTAKANPGPPIGNRGRPVEEGINSRPSTTGRSER